jgi:hypothetical protein
LKHRLERLPEKLRLDTVITKVVASSWLHIANAGLIGSDTECPRLPAEFDWVCKKGHNVESYKLAVLMTKFSNDHKEIILQSDHLLTNLALWALWHYAGRLRVVVSGKVVYDQVLGPEDRVLECRVARFCSQTQSQCAPEIEGEDSTFQVLENIAGNLQSIFKGKYDTPETARHESWTRQELYHTPFRHPKAQKSIETVTRKTAQELLKWYINLPVTTESIYVGSKLSFRLHLNAEDEKFFTGLKVGDLVGRTPRLLNMQCGSLGRPFVVFSGPASHDIPQSDKDSSWDDTGDELQARLNELLDFYPILYDLVDEMKKNCKCYHCDGAQNKIPIHKDESCLAYSALMEVMFYFSHGIADALGAPDASGSGAPAAEDFGASEILHEAIRWNLFDADKMEGTISWHTLLNTAARVFLGSPPLKNFTDAYLDDGGVEVHKSFASHVKPTIVAVQYGALAIIAPWLDISHKLNCKGCFRFEAVRGCIALRCGELQGQHIFRGIPSDIYVIETQRTEDVRDFAKNFQSMCSKPATKLRINKDESQEVWDWVLMSMDQNRHKLLMRVQTGHHSRMVDPSRAIVQLSRTIRIPTCSHTGGSQGVVPQKTIVELNSFDELLGRWDAWDSDDASSSSGDSEVDATPPPKKRKTVGVEGEDEDIQSMRVSHRLDSSFKFNAALALTGDDPVLIDSGGSCLTCSLEYAASVQAENGRDDNCRWVIHTDRNPAKTSPRVMLPARLALPPAEERNPV